MVKSVVGDRLCIGLITIWWPWATYKLAVTSIRTGLAVCAAALWSNIMTFTATSNKMEAVSVLGVAEELRIFRNPSKGQFTFAVPDLAVGGSLTVLDLAGRLVYRQEIQNMSFELPLNRPAGVYRVRIETRNGAQTASPVRILVTANL